MAIRWYKRIFLKVFLIVWLTSFLVITVTAIVVGSVSEQQRYQQVLAAKALGQAELIVDRYERTGRIIPPRPDRFRDHDHDDDDEHRDHRDSDQRDGHKHRDNRRLFPLKMQIMDNQKGVVIFGLRDERRFNNPLKLKLQSENNRAYRVVVDMDLRSTFAARIIGFILSVQVVLMLLVAALASLLISWIIVRPISQLSQHTRNLYNGDLGARTDRRLNNRGDEIGELSREFDRMADYVEQTLQSNQHLLQDVSHELRAPLARLQMAAGLASQNASQADQQHIERINLECERINRLIDEILSLSRLEQLEVTEQAFNIVPVIEGLVSDYRFSAPDHQLHTSLSPCLLTGNPALLERALSNILGNGVKHTPPGSRIDIDSRCNGNQCRIIIRDNGPGLDNQQLKTLFKPFVRFTEQTSGYGLGLSIAQRAIQLLGGSLEASSQPGEGLLLEIRIPGGKI